MSDDPLRKTYKRVYQKFCTLVACPDPIPCPDEVELVWDGHLRRTSDQCYPRAKRIEVNPIYQDPRL